jgi:hypothetical protein
MLVMQSMKTLVEDQGITVCSVIHQVRVVVLVAFFILGVHTDIVNPIRFLYLSCCSSREKPYLNSLIPLFYSALVVSWFTMEK